MKFPCIALLAVGLLAGVLVQAQTVDEIVNKHIEAIGGKGNLNSIKSLYVESDLEVMGNTAPSVTYIVNGKGYRNDVDFNGQKITSVVTPTGGWGINPMTGQTAAQETPAELLKSQMDQYQVGGLLYDYAAKGNKIELQGKEDVSGVSAHKLKLTTKEGSETVFYIDPTSYYVIKTVNKMAIEGQQVEVIIAFSKYTKIDFGYVYPFSMQLTLPQGITLNFNAKKVDVNKDVDMKMFDMPK